MSGFSAHSFLSRLPAHVASRFREAMGNRGRRRENPRAALRRTWGQEIERERFSFQISRYHDLVGTKRRVVDDVTWEDLGMPEVFAKLDRTLSFPGRQVLYHQMRVYEADERVLEERTRHCTVFRSEPEFREDVQMALAGLDGADAAWLAPLLMSEPYEKPKWAWLLHIFGCAPLVCLLGMVWWPILLIPAILLGLMNLLINEVYGRKVIPYFDGLSQIHRLTRSAGKLSALPDPHRLSPLEVLKELAPERLHLQRRLGWWSMGRGQLNDLILSLMTYANLLFLLDIQLYFRSLNALRQHQGALMRMWEAVGSLDAALSVASFMDGAAVIATPSRSEGRHIEAVRLCHPLLAHPVGNSLASEGRSILITGSNMAGKTTFLRTVGINVILAQTLNICLAERASLPRAIVRSSIRREDKLGRGESYYFAELERIRDMLADAESGASHLFLLDEIFRGTNTLERVSAAAAVLHHLGQRHVAMVTTHDLELQSLLAGDFDMYHFSEQIVDGDCHFDYLIRSGPTRGRNAIRLLELNGYPESITRAARELADRLALSGGA